MKDNFSIIKKRENLENSLNEKTSRDLDYYWRNLINLISSFIEISQEKRISFSSLMQERVRESLLELEKILSELEKNGQRELSEKLKESLQIIEIMNFDVGELEKPAEKEKYQKSLSRLLEIIRTVNGKF